MAEMIRLGLQDLAKRKRIASLLALTAAVSLLAYLLLGAFQASLTGRYGRLEKGFLVVQQTGSLGEMLGSRLPAAWGETLAAYGPALVVPEIHTVVGTTPENAVLLRGVPTGSYEQVEDFRVLSGRPLQPGDPPRLAMIGVRLAQERDVAPGGTIEIRGRRFHVIGVFAVGTYADNEAWISLEDAQTLLGWGSDVSVFVVRDGEGLEPGAPLPQGLSVAPKGESGVNLVREWDPIFRLLSFVTLTLGIASAVALANVLWRLAWLRRRELAILRSLGFGKAALTGYLLAQACAIAGAGYLLGLGAALAVGSISQVRTAGISISPVFELRVIGGSLLFFCGITLAGSALPAWWFSRTNLAALLRAD
jgi:ABC-type lipoprotein release transport system permease subunit